LAELAAARRLLLAVVEGVECQLRRVRKLRQRRAHVGREYEHAEAAKLKQ
jgi:hypothetical protein